MAPSACRTMILAHEQGELYTPNPEELRERTRTIENWRNWDLRLHRNRPATISVEA